MTAAILLSMILFCLFGYGWILSPRSHHDTWVGWAIIGLLFAGAVWLIYSAIYLPT